MTYTPPGEDELLSSAGVPAWLRWSGGFAVVVLLVVLLILKTFSDHGGSSAAPSATTAPVVIGPAPREDTQPVALPAEDLPPADVVTEGGVTWVVQGKLLLRRSSGLAHWQAVTVSGPTPVAGGFPASGSTLMLDAETGEIWLVRLGGSDPPLLQVFDARTLQLLGEVNWPRPVLTAAPVRGSLYVADRTGLFRIGVDGSTTSVNVPWARDIALIVPDLSRDRTLVLLGAGQQTRVAVLGEVEPISTVAVSSPLAKATFGVTRSGDIWLAGFSRTGAVLMRLDPRTLRPVRISPITKYLGPGAIVLAYGTDTLLVGAGSGIVDAWCIDGETGTSLQQWQVLPDRAALASGAGYAIVGNGLVRLHLAGGCTG